MCPSRHSRRPIRVRRPLLSGRGPLYEDAGPRAQGAVGTVSGSGSQVRAHVQRCAHEVGFVFIGTGQASRAISTARLSMLPCLHLRPINVLVSNGPSGSLRSGKIRLGGGFPLRCFQRFSRPDVATRRCRGHDSRYTRGQSIPVLSY